MFSLKMNKFLAATFFAATSTGMVGCQTNPTISQNTTNASSEKARDRAKISTNSPSREIISSTSNSSNASLQDQRNLPSLDKTGLIGKTLTPKRSAKVRDAFSLDYGYGYYACGGQVLQGSEELHLLYLRKGLKSRCEDFNYTVALAKKTRGGKSYEIYDAIQIITPKGYAAVAECVGASLTVTKYEDVEFFTKHKQAWVVKNKRIVPVQNLKSVRCENVGYGL